MDWGRQATRLDDLIKVDGLILVSRRSYGKIHIEDDCHTAARAL